MASKAPQDSSDRWSQGVYIGRDRMTGQHILFDYEKMEVCKARTILRVPNSQKWCKVSVAKLTATPFQLHVDETPGVVFQDKPAAEVEKASGEPRQARRV